MNAFANHLTEDRRLVVLRALYAASQYRMNGFLLQRFCERVGHGVSTVALEADLAWLQEAGLLMVERLEGVTVATLTVRGVDVATGRATVPGVQTPQPGA